MNFEPTKKNHKSTPKGVHQGHKARKRFGQNFLIDEEMILEIAQSIEPHHLDHIVEIGPGLGAITRELHDSGAFMTLIELDRDLVSRLKITYHASITAKKLRILNEDILKVDLTSIIAEGGERPAKLIGNLPYNISTPVLFHILDHQAYFSVMTFMLQKEVVDRMSAVPATSAYSALSVILQLECEIEKLFDVPPDSFQPPPKVDSAVVQLRQKTSLLIDRADLKQFRHFVHGCFRQRRKTLRNNLKNVLTVEEIEAVGIDPQLRPEHLKVTDYVALFEFYKEKDKDEKVNNCDANNNQAINSDQL